MSFGDNRHHAADHAPLVGRPRGAAWRTLQADGVVWEGQVVIVGDDADLASRMIVTSRRVTFARGGMLVLDLARDWLRPAPVLRRDGTVLLSITPPGQHYDVPPETIALRLRDGHAAAGHVIAMLAGSGARRISPEAISSADYVRGLLPPLPEPRRGDALNRSFLDADPPDFPRLTAGFDDDPDFAGYDAVKTGPPSTALSPVPLLLAEREPLVRQSSSPTSSQRDRGWNLSAADPIAPRGARRRRGWLFRVGGLLIVLGVSALLGAGRLPLPNVSLAPAAPPAATATIVAATDTGVPTVTQGFVSTVMADSTAFVLGIGAEGVTEPTPAGAAAPAGQATATASAVPTIGPAPAAGAVSPAAPPDPTAAIPSANDNTPVSAAAPADTSGELTAAIESAELGGTLPEFSLVAPNEGAWLAIRLTLTNDAATSTRLSLADFRLIADGEELTPDRKSVVVASVLRLSGAPESLEESITLEPGESQPLALIFNVPATAAVFTVTLGAEEIPVTPTIASLGQGQPVRAFVVQRLALPDVARDGGTLRPE